MMHEPAQPKPQGGPVIPPPPDRATMLRNRRATGSRWPIWLASFALGVALGFGAYQWITGMDFYFDYWLALLS